MGKLFIGVFSIFMFLSFKNFFLEYKEAKTFEKKQRLKYIICGFLIGVGGAVDFLPIIKLPVYPLGAFFAFGALIIFAYTLLKHEILLREWKYKYLLDCMDTFYAMLDREGRIIYLNKRYSGLGYDLRDIYGEYFWDADWFPKEKKDYLKIKEEIQKVIKGEKSSFETVLIDKDNNFYEVLLTLMPLKDTKSQIVGVICEAKNIKEFKKIQARFKLLIDESKDAIISCDDQMKVIIWNKAAQELLGYTPEEMIGKSLLQIVPSQYHQKKIEGFKKFSQTGEGPVLGKTIELLALNKNQEEIPVELSVSKYVQDGKFYALGIMRDIRERKKREEELKKAQEELKAQKDFIEGLIENAPVVIFSMDTQFKIDIFNSTVQSLVSKTKEEAKGRLPEEVLNLDEENKELLYRNLKEVYEKETVKVFDLKVRDIHNEEYILSCDASLIRDFQQNPVGYIVVAQNITERKRLEDNIKEAYNFLNTLIDTSPVAIFTVDTQRRITSWNRFAEKLTGFKKEEVIGKSCDVLQGIPCMQECIVFNDKVPKPIKDREITIISKDKRTLVILKGADLIKDSQGNILGAVESFIDITELKTTQAQLLLRTQELEKAKKEAEIATEAKSRFLASMSHEIRTPMNSILGFADLLLEEKLTPQQREFVEMIKKSGRLLLGLINDILDLSKIEAGRLQIEKSIFNINNLVKEVIEIVRVKVQEKKLGLGYFISTGLPKYLEGDPFRIKQVLLNLLSNAIKFTDKGEIRVIVELLSLEGSKVEVQFTVQDTGKGISPERQEIIFEPFRQEDSSIYKKYGGTGLGLAICKKLVELMEGKIWVESRVGEGSRFSFVLSFQRPSLQEVEEFLSKKPEEEKKPQISENPLILIVEDDIGSLELFQRYLIKHNFRFVSTSKGEEVLKLAKEYKPDLIVLDILLPDKDGWQVLKELKEDPQVSSIPVVVCSILSEKKKAFSLGAIDYIEKPVNEEAFIQRLKRLIKPQISKANILVIDDQPTTLRYLEKILSKREFNPLCFQDPQKALEFIFSQKERIDVIILDLIMPHIDGFSILKILKEDPLTRDIPVLIFTVKKLTPQDIERLDQLYTSLLDKSQSGPEEIVREIEHILGRVSVEEKVTTSEVSLKQARKYLILLVEDNPLNQKLMEFIFKKEGIGYDLAVDGEEAVKKAQEKQYDLILMDILLPKIDGLEATRRIRQIPSYKDTPIIALTAQVMKGDEQKCLEAGCTSYLPKPIDKEKLIREINKYIQLQKKEIDFEEEFKELKREFIIQTLSRLRLEEQKIESQDFQDLVFFGHGIKGAGGSYGFKEISTIGAQIEEAAKNKDSQKLKKLFEDLKELLSKTETEFKHRS